MRTTIRRDNRRVEALSVPRVTLYNARSVWSKWNNLAEDILMRQTDLCILTEVWQKSESKKHQKAIESMFETMGSNMSQHHGQGLEGAAVRPWPVPVKDSH